MMIRSSLLATLRASAAVALALTAWLGMPTAQAALIPSDLTVTGIMAYDTGFATAGSPTGSIYAPSGTGAQSGSMRVTAGSVAGFTNYSNAAVGGPNPRSATLTELNDGIAISGSSASAGGTGGTFAVGIGNPSAPPSAQTMAIHVHNNSATTAYSLTFAFILSNIVDARGPDAFVHSQFSLRNGATEIRFSDLTTDTINGDTILTDPSVSLAILTDNRGESLTFNVAAGADLDLNAFWTLEGGSFAADGVARSIFATSLSLTAATPSTQPPPTVPLPGTLWLLGLGLAALARVKKR